MSMMRSYSAVMMLLCRILFMIPIFVGGVPVEGQSEATHVHQNAWPGDEARDSKPSTIPHPPDCAPDFSKDLFPPFPNVHNPDRSNISTEKWRGTYLFG